MPPSKNIKKGAAALFQNSKEIEKAMKHGATFGAVTKRLGNGGFSVQLGAQKTIQGTPRGLFTKGTMAINLGQIVIVVGSDRPAGDNRPSLPWEIVALIDDKSVADELVRKGKMSAEVLCLANSAGAVETGVVEDDLFAASDSDEDFWAQGVADVRGGLKEQRKAQETAGTISARVACLKKGKSKGLDGSVEAGDLTDPLLFSDPDYQRFKRWRAHKATAVSMSSGGTVTAALQPAAVQTVQELMAQFKLEAETARLAAEQAAIVARDNATARVAAVRAEIAGQTVKDNWDDEEEVDINDL